MRGWDRVDNNLWRREDGLAEIRFRGGVGWTATVRGEPLLTPKRRRPARSGMFYQMAALANVVLGVSNRWGGDRRSVTFKGGREVGHGS